MFPSHDPGRGKTAFLKYLVMNGGCLLVSGGCKDVKCQIAELKENCQEPPNVIAWNLPYAQKNSMSYQGLEAVKDGIFASSKYKGGMVMYPSPVVIVFANFMPDFEKIPDSAGRYKIWCDSGWMSDDDIGRYVADC